MRVSCDQLRDVKNTRANEMLDFIRILTVAEVKK